MQNPLTVFSFKPTGYPDGSTGKSQKGRLVEKAGGRTYTTAVAKPVCSLGGVLAIAVDTLVLIPQKPFAWREFLRAVPPTTSSREEHAHG